MDLVPLERRGSAGRQQFVVQANVVQANDEGEFEFDRLAPGPYLIGVNLRQPPSAVFPFPATYFPGVADRDQAVPIVVGEGTVHEGIDLQLRDPMRQGHLEVLVEGDAGRGEPFACIRVLDEAGSGTTRHPDWAGGPVRIPVLEGLRYRLQAHVDNGASHSESMPVEVTGTAGLRTIALRANIRTEGHASLCGDEFSR